MITLSNKLAIGVKQQFALAAKTMLALSILVAVQPVNAQPGILGNGNGPGVGNGPLSQGAGPGLFGGVLGGLAGGSRGQGFDGLGAGANLPGISPVANNTVQGAVQGGAVQQLNTVIPTISQNLQNISNNQQLGNQNTGIAPNARGYGLKDLVKNDRDNQRCDHQDFHFVMRQNGKVSMQDFHRAGKVSMQDFHFVMRRNDKVSMQDFHFVGAKSNIQDFHFTNAKVHMQDFHFTNCKVSMQDFHFVMRQNGKVVIQDFHRILLGGATDFSSLSDILVSSLYKDYQGRDPGDCPGVLSDVLVTSVRNSEPVYWMQLD